jgi:uncharacterized protein with FMN-binding domain
MGWSFGTVRVEITMQGTRLARVRAVEIPPEGDTGGAGTKPTTEAISAFAAPRLEKEALAAQSADIATVSGATYTCEAFVRSLEGALARARR